MGVLGAIGSISLTFGPAGTHLMASCEILFAGRYLGRLTQLCWLRESRSERLQIRERVYF